MNDDNIFDIMSEFDDETSNDKNNTTVQNDNSFYEEPEETEDVSGLSNDVLSEDTLDILTDVASLNDNPFPSIKTKKNKKNKKKDKKELKPQKSSVTSNTKSTKHGKKRKKMLTPEEKHNRIMTVVYILVGLVAAYCFTFFYVRYLNNNLLTELSEKLPLYNQNQLYEFEKTDVLMDYESKVVYNLSTYLCDTDGDGLTDDYEINVSKTSPVKADSDGDGIPDGLEILAGLDPLSQTSDGKTLDSERTFSRNVTIDNITVTLNGNADIYSVSAKKSTSQISNYPGVVSGLIEISSFSNSISTSISYNSNISSVNLMRYDLKENNFEYFTMTDNKFIINSSEDTQYFFFADNAVFSESAPIEIMFLIDNSGSMYSAQRVENSEENDLEFKRVDFAEKIINSFNDNTSFGAAKFTANYTLLSAMTSDKDKVLNSVALIRNGDEYFNGTEISMSIIKALEEFKNPSSRKYLIMITDGLPSIENAVNNELAVKSCIDNNVAIISIGLGKKIDAENLAYIAEATNGEYFQAMNNLAFDEMCNQIIDLMTNDNFSTIEIDENLSADVIKIGESAFSKNDYLPIINIPFNNDLSCMNLGTALFSKLYFSGDLPISTSGYITSNDIEIDGFDFSGVSFFEDGKRNLSELPMTCASNYNNYIESSNKWDFKNINDGFLRFTIDTNATVNSSFLKIIKSTYTFHPQQTDTMKLLREATFQNLTEFNIYENAIIDSDFFTEKDTEIIKAVRYYDNIYKSQLFNVLSFASEGDAAMNELQSQIQKGKSPVMLIDNKVYNVVRFSSDIHNSNSYVIDAIDINNDCSVCSIRLEGSDLYFNETSNYQYITIAGDKEVTAYISIM